MNTDKKTFVNPTGYWSYFGTYIVELVDGADKSILQKNSKNIINGNEVIVTDGSLGQSTRGISMRDSLNHAFNWGYIWIKSVRKPNGDLIWVNNNYRNE